MLNNRLLKVEKKSIFLNIFLNCLHSKRGCHDNYNYGLNKMKITI